MKRTINVFYDGDYYTLRWLRALILAKKEFEQLGYRIHFHGFSAPIPKMAVIKPPIIKKADFIKIFSQNDYDIVFLAFHHSLPGLGQFSSEDRKDVLSILREHAKTIVWLDTADSTGTPLFDVMPFVDKYLKKQVLRDLTRYTRPIWGGRVFCEYYHNEYGIDDETVCSREFPPVDAKYLPKIGISWNVGLGDLFTSRRIDRFVLHRSNYAPIDFTKPTIDRTIDVHYRGSVWNNIAGFQRKKAIDLIAARNDIRKPDVTKKVPIKEYIAESKSALALVSPFGWGEICGRDFEAFVYGAALIKTDMSHLSTYPEIYIQNETYLSIDWDFSNFNSVIDMVKSSDGRRELVRIATNGQEMYKEYISNDTKKAEFARHIISQIDG